MTHFLLNLLPGILPVLLFLGGLLLMDSFRVVHPVLLASVLALGAAAGVASYLLSGQLMDLLHVSYPAYSRFGAPVLEEFLKAAMMILLFRTGRVGFLVDAAILGLGIGAGFALFENAYYALVFPQANFAVWLVRGLGTALMHGGVTAIFALTTQALRERHEKAGPLAYLPGFALAVLIHMVFNQFTAYPLASAVGTILMLPMGLLFLFDRGEHCMHDCLLQEYETHAQLLADIDSARFRNSRAGRVIQTWAMHRDPAMAGSIFEYIKLHTELVLAAEAMLIAREKGKKAVGISASPAMFTRLHLLERRIGKSALLTLWPHLKFNRRELFEIHQLEARA